MTIVDRISALLDSSARNDSMATPEAPAHRDVELATPGGLRRELLVRLGLAAAALSVVLGAIGAVVEMRRGDLAMMALAKARALEFVGHVGRADLGDEEHVQGLRAAAEGALRSGFSRVRVYDVRQRLLFEAGRQPGRSTAAAWPVHVHAVAEREAEHFHTHWLAAPPYMQVLIPIEANGARVAYFDGVYEVDDATVRAMGERLATSIAIVVAVVIATTTILYPIIMVLYRGLASRSLALLRGNVELMEVLGSAVAARDSETCGHNFRVTLYAVRLGEALQLPQSSFAPLIAGSFLHDVGKIGVPDRILTKPGPLDARETLVMRTHVRLGLEILSSVHWLRAARDVVAFHHERFDGSGYPGGLGGDSIPILARIFAVADVFDALTSQRCYKPALSLEAARAQMRAARGSHFDARVFDAFDAIVDPLYAEIAASDETRLRRELRELVSRYFVLPTEAPSPGSRP